MHRTPGVRGLALAVVIAVGCAGSAAPAAPARPASPAELAALEGATVLSVAIEGNRSLAAGPLLAGLESRAGRPLDREAVAADLRRLWAAAAFADVAAQVRRQPDGVALVFAVVERPLVRAARVEGDRPPAGARRIAGLAGGLHEPARLRRMAERLETSFRRAGHHRAAVSVRTLPAGPGRVDVVFRADAGPRYLVGAITFTGQARVPGATLRAAIDTRDGAVNRTGAPYRGDLLADDLARMQVLFWDAGLIEAELGPPVVTADERTRQLEVVVPVREGAVYRLGRIRLPPPLARHRRRALAALGLRPGETFSRARVTAGIERLRVLARRLTRRELSPAPESAVDRERRTIDLTLVYAEAE